MEESLEPITVNLITKSGEEIATLDLTPEEHAAIIGLGFHKLILDMVERLESEKQ